MSEHKQPGRRYGPPPKNPPHPRMQAPTPMTTARRFQLAGARLTDRRVRQLYRMGLRHDDPWSARRRGAKGTPTPKRPKRKASR